MKAVIFVAALAIVLAMSASSSAGGTLRMRQFVVLFALAALVLALGPTRATADDRSSATLEAKSWPQWGRTRRLI